MKKILIWGTGQLSWQPGKEFNKGEIIGYIDTNKKSSFFAKKPVYKPEEIRLLEYDAIIVSTMYAKEIYDQCINYGIDRNKLICAYGNILTQDINTDYKFIEKICGKSYAKQIKDRYHLIREIDDYSTKIKSFNIGEYKECRPYKVDYVRVKTFELLVDEIRKNKIKGNVSELGVFKGEFAEFINGAFPDRVLYLFDTFEGFNEDELTKGSEGEVQNAFRDIFKETSIDIVKNRMRFKDNVVIKKGYFPGSLDGLEDSFAFVSLDCDWEESLYQGILYFYPRLTQGGYIMIHDYNNALDCADKAIRRYEKEIGKLLPKVPICDTQGSIILTK